MNQGAAAAPGGAGGARSQAGVFLLSAVLRAGLRRAQVRRPTARAALPAGPPAPLELAVGGAVGRLRVRRHGRRLLALLAVLCLALLTIYYVLCDAVRRESLGRCRPPHGCRLPQFVMGFYVGLALKEEELTEELIRTGACSSLSPGARALTRASRLSSATPAAGVLAGARAVVDALGWLCRRADWRHRRRLDRRHALDRLRLRLAVLAAPLRPLAVPAARAAGVPWGTRPWTTRRQRQWWPDAAASSLAAAFGKRAMLHLGKLTGSTLPFRRADAVVAPQWARCAASGVAARRRSELGDLGSRRGARRGVAAVARRRTARRAARRASAQRRRGRKGRGMTYEGDRPPVSRRQNNIYNY